jgi:ECF transporter S component (folate family)
MKNPEAESAILVWVFAGLHCILDLVFYCQVYFFGAENALASRKDVLLKFPHFFMWTNPRRILMPKVKKIVLGSLLLAILIVVERLVSIQTPILRISFAYVPIILSGILLGPIWSTTIAVLGDLLGMLLFPKSSFFIGFTMSAALTGLIYGLLLYNTKSNKTFLIRLIISNFLVLLFIHVGLTSLWIAITLQKAFWVFAPPRIISAGILFPIEVSSMYVLKRLLERPISRYLQDVVPSVTAPPTAVTQAVAGGTSPVHDAEDAL